MFLKYMTQRFVRLLFDFTCSFVFMISAYSDKFVQTLPICQRIFLFADRWGDSESNQEEMGKLKKSRTPCTIHIYLSIKAFVTICCPLEYIWGIFVPNKFNNIYETP